MLRPYLTQARDWGPVKPSIPPAHYQLLWEWVPGLFLVLLPDEDFTIVTASSAYLRATMTKLDDIVGRGIFHVFPDNPDDPDATGSRNLRASFQYVVHNRLPHTMETQKYDIRRPDHTGGGFEERYWSPYNCPVLDADGNLIYLIHKVDDVTENLRLRRRGEDQTREKTSTCRL
jgi:PAS domain-containing protein